MSEECPFCHEPVNPFDSATWKEVIGWVGGPRKDSMRLRANTGHFAHDSCVGKAQSGQPTDQPDLLGEGKVIESEAKDFEFEDVFDENI